MQQQVIVENLCFIFSTQGLNGTWGQNSSLFLWHEFYDFMEKEPCTKFCGVLIHSSHEVMKLQSFESGMIDVIPANVQNIFHGFMAILTISRELMKLQSFEWLNCASMQVTSYTQMMIHNMLIVTYM